jgi:hypothetical protein
MDLLVACSLNENGEFRIPLNDPIQSKRIEQLLNSIIKNRVNKQEIAGGPVVQVTNFGTSRRLHIRFNDKQGNLLKNLEEYQAEGHSEEEWKKYIEENQGGIAYYEVYAPATHRKFFEDFGDSFVTRFVDPAMADNGSLYTGFDDSFVQEMASLCGDADIIVPNLTEACLMTGTEYRTDYSVEYIYSLLTKLADLGTGKASEETDGGSFRRTISEIPQSWKTYTIKRTVKLRRKYEKSSCNRSGYCQPVR